MHSVLKWSAIVFGVVLVLLAVVAGVVYGTSESRIRAKLDVPVLELTAATATADAEEGRRLTAMRGCVDCHGEDLGGRVFVDEPGIGFFAAPNLTGGRGGVGPTYSDAELARAIRQGLRSDGSKLLLMPSHEYQVLSDSDVADMIAYMRSLPPVDRELSRSRVGLVLRAVYVVTGEVPLLSADEIDHASVGGTGPEPAVTLEYGEYLASSCTGCHGPGFSGGKPVGSPPDFPVSSNLTPRGTLGDWTSHDFTTFMRTGRTPRGERIDAERMPWPVLGQMSDVELDALFLYLQSVPPRESGNL